MIRDLRNWYEQDQDWRKTYQRIAEQYGYQDYIGGCHMVPNHALIILGLLYGQGDFQKSLMVCNTCGWDTDCNSGNLGCLLGIRNGLAGFEGVDWRGPVADRIYLPTADGGRCVTDAVRETIEIVNIGRALNDLPPLAPKEGARFHFDLAGSVQGVQVEKSADTSPYVSLENVAGHSRKGARSLAVRYAYVGERVVARVSAPTYIFPEDRNMQGYQLIASPTLYPGQTVRVGLGADAENPGAVEARLYVQYYDAGDQPARRYGPSVRLKPGAYQEMDWALPELSGFEPPLALIYALGVELARPQTEAEEAQGVVYLDYLTWAGAPKVTFERPEGEQAGAGMWRANWVNAVDQWDWGRREAFRLIQNEGRGMISTGTREWSDYRVTAKIRPALVRAGGLAARVQGLRRYYALELTQTGLARLVKMDEGKLRVLAEQPCAWELWHEYTLSLAVEGDHLRGWLDGELLLEAQDTRTAPFLSGGVGLVVEEGHLMTEAVRVEPL